MQLASNDARALSAGTEPSMAKSVTAWRLARPEHARTVDEMLSGEGALRYGGRWNSPGRRAVYLGGCLALASLELLVHVRAPDVVARYRKLPVRMSDDLIDELEASDLPADWAAPALNPATQNLGDRWIESQASVVLRVPSAVVADEVNYIANPAHPDFGRLRPGTIADYRFDARVLKTR